MKIVNYGENYEIYSDNLKTFDTIPAATYKVTFHPMSGFSLIKVDDFETIEEKIYGSHNEKIEKVLKTYESFNRSLGIILSGEKGMGKSLFVQLLAQRAIEQGLPVVIVSKDYPGIAEFIEKIDQEALIIFDEFEKVFGHDSEKGETQDQLLGLFDGLSQKKRIYAITVNKIHKVSEFMLSRTGRFHYHIRFDYPSANEIEIYLKDKLEKQYHDEIKRVLAFAGRVQLNYDSLRAIAFELNQGYSFAEAISDLNILSTDQQRFDVRVFFSNGKTEELKGQNLNLFEETIQFEIYADGGNWLSLHFETKNIESNGFAMLVEGDHVELDVADDNTVYTKDVKVVSIAIAHHRDPSINYKLSY